MSVCLLKGAADSRSEGHTLAKGGQYENGEVHLDLACKDVERYISSISTENMDPAWEELRASLTAECNLVKDIQSELESFDLNPMSSGSIAHYNKSNQTTSSSFTVPLSGPVAVVKKDSTVRKRGSGGMPTTTTQKTRSKRIPSVKDSAKTSGNRDSGSGRSAEARKGSAIDTSSLREDAASSPATTSSRTRRSNTSKTEEKAASEEKKKEKGKGKEEDSKKSESEDGDTSEKEEGEEEGEKEEEPKEFEGRKEDKELIEALKSDMLDRAPNVKWDDIAGLKEAKGVRLHYSKGIFIITSLLFFFFCFFFLKL